MKEEKTSCFAIKQPDSRNKQQREFTALDRHHTLINKGDSDRGLNRLQYLSLCMRVNRPTGQKSPPNVILLFFVSVIIAYTIDLELKTNSVCLSVCLPACLPVCLPVYLSVCLSVFVCLSVSALPLPSRDHIISVITSTLYFLLKTNLVHVTSGSL